MEPREQLITWWNHIVPTLQRLAKKRGLPADLASDLVQDVAILALAKFKEEEDFFSLDYHELNSWVLARFHWLLLDRFRIERKHEGIVIDDLSLLSSPSTQELSVLIQEVKRAIRGLPEQQQKALERQLAGQGTREIATALNIEESSVRSLLRHARHKLTRMLGEPS